MESDVYHGDSLYIPVSENSCTAFYIAGVSGACARTMYYNGYGCAVGGLAEFLRWYRNGGKYEQI